MAQTYKFGNGTWARKKGSTLAYNDEDNNFKPLPFSFERDSIATRVNKEGLIEVVGNDIPRIDYTDSTEGALLLENSATNLITYSEDFTQWTKLNGGTGFLPIVTSNNSISPDGTQNADKIVLNKGNALSNSDYSLIRLDYGGSDVNGTSSVYLKSDVNVDIEISSDDISYKTISVTTKWKRFEVSDATSDRLSIGLRGTEPSTSNATIYAWGAMLEANSVASSYIPTNGSTIQRTAETCSGSGNSEVFNSQEGILFANIAELNEDNTLRTISISDGSNNNNSKIYYFNDEIYFDYKVSGSTVSSLSYSGDLKIFNKVVAKYKANDFSLWVNGFEVDTEDNGSVNPINTFNRLNFDTGNNTQDFYGKTKEIAYYDEILTDAELEYMTSYRSLNEMVTELNLNAL